MAQHEKITPEQLKDILEHRGWSVEIVAPGNVPALVPTEKDHVLKCVDGRPSNRLGMRGPKVLGGVYGIASARGWITLDKLEEVVAEVSRAGYTPSVHGDHLAEHWALGCGYFKLWKQGAFAELGLKEPAYGGGEGKDAVVGAGGVTETLAGAHYEDFTVINYVPGHTIEPMAIAQKFVVDEWVVDLFGLDPGLYLTLAAETVERLGGVRWAKIISPS